MKYIKISKLNADEYINNYDILVCLLRPSRNKAIQLAILEMSIVLSVFDGIFIFNGPLGDVRGLISFFVKRGSEDKLQTLIKSVGYCNKFYKLDFSLKNNNKTDDILSINKYFWKGHEFNVIRFYLETEDEYKDQSIMNRLFAVYQSDNTIKYIKGYRGDGSEAGRRGLPLEDARLMVNLVDPYSIKSILDPFAGSGGIIYSARHIRSSLYLISADIDKIIEPGLKIYSDAHYTRDARKLDIKEGIVDAIVTEIPFSPNYTKIVIQALYNLTQYLSENGKVLFMCHIDQFSKIKNALRSMGFYLLIHKEVNRKGTSVFISLWSKNREFYESSQEYFQVLKTVL